MFTILLLWEMQHNEINSGEPKLLFLFFPHLPLDYFCSSWACSVMKVNDTIKRFSANMTICFGERRKERSQGVRDSISYKAGLDIKKFLPMFVSGEKPNTHTKEKLPLLKM